jgi:N-methylhydantoinase A/oxoprolinase/acetone carboxylase beta subunit
MKNIRIGIDPGGTFPDFVIFAGSLPKRKK